MMKTYNKRDNAFDIILNLLILYRNFKLKINKY